MSPRHADPTFEKARLLKALVCIAALHWPVVSMATQGSDGWAYHADRDSAITTGARTLWLSDQMPDDLEIKAKIDADQIKYTVMQYGSTASRFVTIALAGSAPDQVLYVDTNRDRVLSENEKFLPEGNCWQVDLKAEFPSDDAANPQHLDRTVKFCASRFGHTLSYSTIGYLTGKLSIATRANETDDSQGRSRKQDLGVVSVRVCDADGNGRFGDADDVILIDLNRDRRFDSFLETMTCKKGVEHNDAKYQLLANELGTQIDLKVVDGAGTVEFVLGVAAEIVSAKMLLVGKDGTSVSLTFDGEGKSESTIVPVGDYRIASLSLTLIEPFDAEKWHYTFSGTRDKKMAQWFRVDQNEAATIDPMENLRFHLQVHDGTGLHKAGELLTLTPQLTTSTGLVINNCWQGDESLVWMQDSRGATIRLDGVSSDKPIVCTSGFR